MFPSICFPGSYVFLAQHAKCQKNLCNGSKDIDVRFRFWLGMDVLLDKEVEGKSES